MNLFKKLSPVNHQSSIINHQWGFTLVELLVVIGMISILLISLIVTFNPVAQYNKATDGTREHDLGQIQRALDTYFNDTGCYPQSLTFGSKWSSGSTVYMEKVPQDPGCSQDSSKCYVYETDTTTDCPQWDVLYAALRSSAVPVNACPLESRTSCLPSGFHNTPYNYCVISGNTDCSVVEGYVVTSSGNGGSGGGGGGGGGGNPTATPTPTGIVCPGDQYSGCTGSKDSCNSIGNQSDCTQNGGSKAFCYCDKHCDQQCPGGN